MSANHGIVIRRGVTRLLAARQGFQDERADALFQQAPTVVD